MISLFGTKFKKINLDDLKNEVINLIKLIKSVLNKNYGIKLKKNGEYYQLFMDELWDNLPKKKINIKKLKILKKEYKVIDRSKDLDMGVLSSEESESEDE